MCKITHFNFIWMTKITVSHYNNSFYKKRKQLPEDIFTYVINYLDLQSHIKSQLISKRYLQYIYKSIYIPKKIILHTEKINISKLFLLINKYKNIQNAVAKLKNNSEVSVSKNLCITVI